MVHALPPRVLGVVMTIFLILNTLFWATWIYVGVLFKLILPRGRAYDAASRVTAWLAQSWAMVNVWMVDHSMRVQWDIRIDANLNPRGQYLVCSNHQTWNDIFVLMKTFGRKAPFFKFFIKQELIWVPVLGLAWWGLDYPFMKRYSAEQLQKQPELKGKDLDTTRKACDKYKTQPVLILNFLEGTRFTPAKHARQQSPYRHLLKPKSGGFAFALSALGGRLDSLLDVTIVYPEGAMGFWDFMCGRVRKVTVEVRELKIQPEYFAGDYENDPVFRKRFQDWIAGLWAEKDQRIARMLGPSSGDQAADQSV